MFESVFSPITEVIDVYCSENRNVGNNVQKRVKVCSLTTWDSHGSDQC